MNVKLLSAVVLAGIANMLSACSDPSSTSAAEPAGPIDSLGQSDASRSAARTASDFYIADRFASAEGAKIEARDSYELIFDTSGSMGDAPPRGGDKSFKKKLPAAQWAFEQFIRTVPMDANVGLIVFENGRVKELVPLGPNNHERVKKAVSGLRADGGTPLAPAIELAADRLFEQRQKQLGVGSLRLVSMSDGEADDLPKACEYAAKRRCMIYAYSFGTDSADLPNLVYHYQRADSAQQLAEGMGEATAEIDIDDEIGG